MIIAMLGWVFVVAAVLDTTSDPIKAELDKARAAYAEGLETAKTKLIASIDAKLREVAGQGDFDNAKEITSQRTLFETKGTLPSAAMLTRAKGEHESDLNAARVSLRKALEKAKADYTKAIKLDEAQAISNELNELVAFFPSKKSGNANTKTEPTVVATWAHQVGKGPGVLRKTFKMYSNGKINTPDGRDTWQIKGRLMILTWQSAKAPDGAWTDVVNLSNDGNSYLGKNNEGTPILGTKLSVTESEVVKKK